MALHFSAIAYPDPTVTAVTAKESSCLLVMLHGWGPMLGICRI
ncbi:hypothetical protein NON20_18205 [Synechocystis sp. B12]|nr:hypothetical protein NON20_18205 [Synechocystis sp. B12]